MYKSSSRNQRSKGIKVKHVIQICLLVALCCWLIYQVKHSHDKKREFDDSAKNSIATEQKDGVVKLGRKYLNPQMKDKVIETGKQDEEEEEETAVEEVDIKREEMEELDDTKIDEKEEEEDIDEGRGGGEEIDDQDQEKSDTDNDQEVEFVDNEKEGENVDEQELEDKDAEDDKGQSENDSASGEHYQKIGGVNTREAREENYKADDASGAVTYDSQIATADNQNMSTPKSNQKTDVSEFDDQTQSVNPDEIGAGKNPPRKVEGGETAAITTSNMTKGSENHKYSNNMNAVRIERQDEDVVEEHKNTRFQTIDNKLEDNSTLPGRNDQHNFSLSINTDSKDIDLSLKESNKSDGSDSSISKMGSNVSANASEKSEETFDMAKDNRADGTNEQIDESISDTSDELEVDLIDASDSTNSLEENYI